MEPEATDYDLENDLIGKIYQGIIESKLYFNFMETIHFRNFGDGRRRVTLWMMKEENNLKLRDLKTFYKNNSEKAVLELFSKTREIKPYKGMRRADFPYLYVKLKGNLRLCSIGSINLNRIKILENIESIHISELASEFYLNEYCIFVYKPRINHTHCSAKVIRNAILQYNERNIIYIYIYIELIEEGCLLSYELAQKLGEIAKSIINVTKIRKGIMYLYYLLLV